MATRSRTPTEKGKSYQESLVMEESCRMFTKVQAEIAEAEALLNQPHTSEMASRLKRLHDNLSTKSIEMQDLCERAERLDFDHPDTLARLKELSISARSTMLKIITITKGGRSVCSTRSQRSKSSRASASTRSSKTNIEILKLRLKDNQTQREREEEMERLEREHQWKLARIKSELERDRLLAEIKMEEIKIRAGESDASSCPGSDSESECVPQRTSRSQDNHHTIPGPPKYIYVNHLPVLEPEIFSGDPLKYTAWLNTYEALMEQSPVPTPQKLQFLQRYLGGEAKEAVTDPHTKCTEKTYQAAKRILETRFGSKFAISEAYREKLELWPRVQAKDRAGLRRFSDFLNQCQKAAKKIPYLKALDDMREIGRLVNKLPEQLINRWQTMCTDIKDATGEYPQFQEFAAFLTKASNQANDPVINCISQPTTQRVASTLATSTVETKNCVFCHSKDHFLATCTKFMAESLTDRRDFVKRERRCFGCLRIGHNSRSCTGHHKCRICSGKHPTCLHEERGQLPEETESKVLTTMTSNRSSTTTTIPVWVSSRTNPTQERLVYALLDSGSDTTFIDQAIANSLHLVNTETARLRIDTIKGDRPSTVVCDKLPNLRVRGYNCSIFIDLPPAYSIKSIPMCTKTIPDCNSARKWPHLQHVAKEIPPPLECEPGLLIGFNCSRAFIPRGQVIGDDSQPFAVRTDLGWTIMGPSCPLPNNHSLAGQRPNNRKGRARAVGETGMRAKKSNVSGSFSSNSDDDNQGTSKVKYSEPAYADCPSATSVKLDAETTMSNEASTKNTSSATVAMSVSCQADEDSEYEWADCTEWSEESRYRHPRFQGKPDQYSVDCDIHERSSHGHHTRLPPNDMQRNIQDREKYDFDKGSLEGVPQPGSLIVEAIVLAPADTSAEPLLSVKLREGNGEITKQSDNKESMPNKSVVSKATAGESGDMRTTPKEILIPSTKKDKQTVSDSETTTKRETSSSATPKSTVKTSLLFINPTSPNTRVTLMSCALLSVIVLIFLTTFFTFVPSYSGDRCLGMVKSSLTNIGWEFPPEIRWE
ncbi:hypothetical protein Ahia01_000727600, partial [Argonauta hians]